MRLDRLQKVGYLIEVYQAKALNLAARIRAEPDALHGSLETGAVRRASMDLTRALADLRRPDNA
jgi:hypothetical protein